MNILLGARELISCDKLEATKKQLLNYLIAIVIV